MFHWKLFGNNSWYAAYFVGELEDRNSQEARVQMPSKPEFVSDSFILQLTKLYYTYENHFFAWFSSAGQMKLV